ncbi:uncharacterized protein DNG_00061 [Cephalotrichum gorgonifer]|uniref:DUF1996 domain-containing protein n=1 Tax=Cephalotrichum gorgonifer TaxID=2041049 RepID=A0AAE8SQK0_9PEZI|nr:uncharacterized protein DNG_00061 [Cephalotrichum gorgonifer]
MSCSQLVLDQVDPIDNPGVVPSAHLNQIVGGDSFNSTMDPADDPAQLSTCTTCTFPDDLSNYWTPVMFFRARNVRYKRVTQMGALPDEEARGGGMTIYYTAPDNDTNNVVAFKKGFRMRTGNPEAQTGEEASANQSIDYTCLDEEGTPSSNRSETFPDHMCPGGILTTIYFPPCWDGENLDSPDHYSHVSWPTEGDSTDGAPCPATHPVKIPQVILETRWDTRPYNLEEMWPEDSSQPFLWSFGDDVGSGPLGDYMFGWKGDALQKAFDSESCSDQICGLDTQTITEANECRKDSLSFVDSGVWSEHLPGMPVDATLGR